MTCHEGIFLAVGREFALAGLITFLLITQLPAKNKPVTLSGIVTDSMCGAKHMITGDDGKCVRSGIKSGSAHVACAIQNKQASATVFNLKCARECARLGSPLIVLTPDGTLYTPISESMPEQDQRQRLMPFLGKYVRFSGPAFERNGTRAIAIGTIEEMKDVQLLTDAE